MCWLTNSPKVGMTGRKAPMISSERDFFLYFSLGVSLASAIRSPRVAASPPSFQIRSKISSSSGKIQSRLAQGNMIC